MFPGLLEQPICEGNPNEEDCILWKDIKGNLDLFLLNSYGTPFVLNMIMYHGRMLFGIVIIFPAMFLFFGLLSMKD